MMTRDKDAMLELIHCMLTCKLKVFASMHLQDERKHALLSRALFGHAILSRVRKISEVLPTNPPGFKFSAE